MSLENVYASRFEKFLTPTAENIKRELTKYFRGWERIDSIAARAKDLASFLNKATKTDAATGKPKYPKPLIQIQDQVGARIVTYYKGDIEPIARKILEFYTKIEEVERVPDDVSKFGYEGYHFILHIPNDVVPDGCEALDRPHFFELQVKTVFQHAWAVAGHDLSYKSSNPLTEEDNRLVAYAAAQAWGADKIFDELTKDRIPRLA